MKNRTGELWALNFVIFKRLYLILEPPTLYNIFNSGPHPLHQCLNIDTGAYEKLLEYKRLESSLDFTRLA